MVDFIIDVFAEIVVWSDKIISKFTSKKISSNDLEDK